LLRGCVDSQGAGSMRRVTRPLHSKPNPISSPARWKRP